MKIDLSLDRCRMLAKIKVAKETSREGWKTLHIWEMSGGLAGIQLGVEGTGEKTEQTQRLNGEASSPAEGIGFCSEGREEPLTNDKWPDLSFAR